MKCADIMSKNLEWLTESDTIQRAAAVMADAGVGFLPICDSRRRVVGVVTDRDLTIRAIAKKVSPETTSAALVMTSPAITCLDTADIREAETLMAEERKSRIAIADGEGRLVGVISLADVVEHAPEREALTTIRAVLWREALGPRGGAPKGQPLLQDDPIARSQRIPEDGTSEPSSVFQGGHRLTDTKEFPG